MKPEKFSDNNSAGVTLHQEITHPSVRTFLSLLSHLVGFQDAMKY